MQRDLSSSPLLTLLLALTITHVRIPHFYVMHRLMHPWKTTRVPDVGKFLYRQIHSLHHKSYNPTAFSGNLTLLLLLIPSSITSVHCAPWRD